jgi:CheY-like chemotaxis protein
MVNNANPPSLEILVIGQDRPLIYLLGRFAEKGGYRIIHLPSAPASETIRALHPHAIVFAALDDLEKAQAQVADLSSGEIPILVCSSGTDLPEARDLGADHYLLHPLSYEAFQAALAPNPEQNPAAPAVPVDPPKAA